MLPVQTNGLWQIHWLLVKSQNLGAGHSTQFGPYLPAGHSHLLVAWFQLFVGGGHKHLLVFQSQTLGAGHGSQLFPNVFGGQMQVLLFGSQVVFGAGHEHCPLTIDLGASQHEHSWVKGSQVCPGSQVTHLWVSGSQYLGALHLTQYWPAAL